MTMPPLRRRLAALIAAALSATLVLTACGSESDDASNAAGETRTIEADNGTVEVPADPQRVVVIGRAALAYLDLGGKPVGVSDITVYVEPDRLPEEQKAAYEAAEIISNSSGERDLEKIASLKPDLIIAQYTQDDWDSDGAQLESIAPTVFTDLTTDWKIKTTTLAEAANKADEFKKQKQEYEDQLANIKETYSEIVENSTVISLEGWAPEPGMFSIWHNECTYGDLGLNIPDAEEPIENVSFEQIGELSKYDILLYPVEHDGQVPERFAPVVETRAWQALPNVTSGHALGVYCPGNSSYGQVLEYLDSLERGLESVAAKE